MPGAWLISLSVLFWQPAYAQDACEQTVDATWVRTLSAAAEAGWQSGQMDAVRVGARAIEAQTPCLETRLSAEDASRIHRVMAMELLLDGAAESAIRHLAASQRLVPDWPLAEADESTLGRAWDRARVQPATAHEPVPVPAGAELWVDGLPATSLPSGRPALVQLTVRGQLRRTRLTAGEYRAVSEGWRVQEERSRLSRSLGEMELDPEVPDAPALPTATAPAAATASSASTVGTSTISPTATVLIFAEGGIGFGTTQNRYSRLSANIDDRVDRASWDRMESLTIPVASIGLGLRIGEFAELRVAIGVFGRQQIDAVYGAPREQCTLEPTSCPTGDPDQTIGTNAYWVTEEDPTGIGGLDGQLRIAPFAIGPVRPFVLLGLMPRFYFNEVDRWNWMWQVGGGARMRIAKQVDVHVSLPVAPVQEGMELDIYRSSETAMNDVYVSRNTGTLEVFGRLNVGIDVLF